MACQYVCVGCLRHIYIYMVSIYGKLRCIRRFADALEPMSQMRQINRVSVAQRTFWFMLDRFGLVSPHVIIHMHM